MRKASDGGRPSVISSLGDMLRDSVEGTGEALTRALYAGHLPDHPDHILAPAREGARDWSDHEFAVTDFAPPISSLRAGLGPPHIRLDAAAEFLLADRMG